MPTDTRQRPAYETQLTRSSEAVALGGVHNRARRHRRMLMADPCRPTIPNMKGEHFPFLLLFPLWIVPFARALTTRQLGR